MSNIWLNDRTCSCYSKTDAAQSAPCHCLPLTPMDKCLLNTCFYKKVTFKACVHDHGFLITQPLSEYGRKQIINPHLLHSLLASHCGAKRECKLVTDNMIRRPSSCNFVAHYSPLGGPCLTISHFLCSLCLSGLSNLTTY